MAGMRTMGWYRAGAAVGTLGVALALLTAPAAGAEPEVPVEPQPPLAAPVEAAPEAPAAAVPVAAPADGAPAAVPVSVVPPEGVPHLPSPDNLPPGTTTVPPEGRNLSYLREIWHAVRNQDVTMGDALLLIAQRPMDSKATLQDMTPHRQSAVPPAPEAAPAEAPAPQPAPEPATPPLPPAAEAPQAP